ncbi:unnamed protein product, partial [Caenorhabditis brenneri]
HDQYTTHPMGNYKGAVQEFPLTRHRHRMLLDDGATLMLTNDRTISYFRSADGMLERGVADQPDVEDEPMDDGDIMEPAPNMAAHREVGETSAGGCGARCSKQ